MAKRREIWAILLIIIAGLMIAAPGTAATTELHIVKYASDGTTIISETTKTYQWLEANLPVLGDGITHYYHQGPVFIDDPDPDIEQQLRWNPDEDNNEKDQGAVKGTNLKDICDLVGGMNAGETVKLLASDGFFKTFAYENVYNYPARQGPMVITWYQDGAYPDGAYSDGMKLVFFADDSVNPWGYNMMGNYDWHESAAPEYWYYYVSGTEQYPTTSGLSVKIISDIIIYSDDPAPPEMDILYSGPVTLTPGETFDKIAYNSGITYTINRTTPLGALDVAATTAGFTYDVTDKNYATSGALLLDNVDGYLRKTPGYWYAYVNDAYKDGYNNPAGGLNLIELADGDRAEFYYAAGVSDPTDLAAVKAVATAAVKTVADIPPPYDLLFDGPVVLTPGETFDKVAYNSGATYTISRTTPLGALDVAATTASFTYDVTDKNFATSGALLLDNVDGYLRKAPGYWYAYVNDAYKDGYNNPDGGLNLIELADGDRAEFYYAAGITDPTDLAAVKTATIAAVKTVASTGVTPTDWSIVLAGARTETVTKTYFESGLACPASGHQVFWTDDDGNEWGGVPLWLLMAMVDDDPDVGPDHFNLNDDLAAQHYEVKVISSDGWSAVFDSADVARSSDYLVANTLNGEPLPILTEGGKPSWPLHLKGASVLGGQQVGGIARIELNNLPQPPDGWTLAMLGEVGDTITQQEFEEGLACTMSGHLVEWTDISGNVWSGVPLWVLLGAVDDIELADHWTFNDDVAAEGYTVKVIAADGFSKTFSGTTLARNNNYIVANKMNGAPLPDSAFPLRLVGSGVTKSDGSLGGSAVGKIAQIEIVDLQTPPAEPGSYNLALKGKITDVLSQAEIEEGIACPMSGHLVTWTQQIKDANGNVIETHEYSGIPLWFLAGWVDDRKPHDFNAVQAMAGYKITVKASDGYAKDFTSTDVAWSDNYIVATMKDGAPLPDGKWPLQLVGDPLTRADGTLGGMSVSKIAEIELTEFGVPVEIPRVHIVKYGPDQQTIVSDVYLDYTQMQQQFDIIGDGATQYRYQGVTLDPTDIWGVADETTGGFKISNAVKGTRIYDLVQLVGGMGEGTDIVFVAGDGYKTILPYTSIYTTPDVQERQGDAILAWYADGKYVPGYSDGMRLFFMPEDTIYGQWDMHETMPPGYWHYYYQSYPPTDPVYGQYAPGILYPSCAGLSAKYVAEIRVYTTPESDWNLHLDGTRVGGIEYTVNKAYFEAALACQFGANHDASYTDSSGNVWTGMPLWFLQGFVDDADQHSNVAFNESLALEGYDIIVSAPDGYGKTFNSADTIRSTGYIVANTLNGYHIPESDSSWPLRLVGDNVPKKDNVKKISDITLNFRPDVSAAYPSKESLWPANNKFVDITIEGITDPYDEVTIAITKITSDEATTAGGKNKAPDAEPSCIGTDTAKVRAERNGNGNGRVYEITFVATDSIGAQSEGTVHVCVPHDQGHGSDCIDDGQLYDATVIN